MQECEFDYAFIARYNTRNGTVASKWEDDVPAREKARRWSILNDILQKTARARNMQMIGRKEEILITAGTDDSWTGRTRNFKEVYIPKHPEISVGTTVLVNITSLDGWILRGVTA
jgi:tRNA-2-methylthio-N6-dimethylallyladenosine synthase